MQNDELSAPEFLLLKAALGDEDAALKLATAPGGWRDLDRRELRELGIEEHHAVAVRAIQQLLTRSWPQFPQHKLLDANTTADVYTPRVAGSKDEEVVALALDGDGHLIEEITVGVNTGHGFGLQEPARVLRPLIKAGAQAFVIVMNMPEGKPRATPDICRFAERLQEAGNAVGIQLHDVVVIGNRDHGWLSLAERGVIGT